MMDVLYECTSIFGVDIDVSLDNIERTIVFLAKYGNLPPDWVERQDIIRQNKLVRAVSHFVRTSRVEVQDNEPPL